MLKIYQFWISSFFEQIKIVLSNELKNFEKNDRNGAHGRMTHTFFHVRPKY